MIGIVMANCLFWAFLLSICVNGVRSAMNRNPVQQIGLTGQANNSDSFEDD